jgi:hypothetical protein
MKIIKTHELHLVTRHRVGELANVLRVVSDAHVNILAYAGYADGKEGHIHLVTEDNARVQRALARAGYTCARRPVVVVKSRDVVGRGARLAQRISEAGVNLKSAYATAAGGKYITVYEAADSAQLARALHTR